MSAKSPPLTDEQKAFEQALLDGLETGTSVGFGRTEAGIYQAPFVRQAWQLWQFARRYERMNCNLCRNAF